MIVKSRSKEVGGTLKSQDLDVRVALCEIRELACGTCAPSSLARELWRLNRKPSGPSFREAPLVAAVCNGSGGGLPVGTPRDSRGLWLCGSLSAGSHGGRLA